MLCYWIDTSMLENFKGTDLMEECPYLIYERDCKNHFAIVLNNKNIKKIKNVYHLKDDICKCNDNELVLDNHWHFHYQVLYVKKNEIEVFIDGKYKKFSEGSIIFIEPFKVHGVRIKDIKNTVFLKVIESFNNNISYYNLLNKSKISIPKIEDMNNNQLKFRERLIVYFDRLIELENEFDELSEIERKNLIDRIFFVLIKFFSNNDDKENSKNFEMDLFNNRENYWILIIKYINNNFDKKITLNDISLSINLCPSYLSNYFKKKTGITITSYIEKVRMAHALNDLNKLDISVEKIAIKNGFSDSKSLNRVLKREFGKTAKNFRSN